MPNTEAHETRLVREAAEWRLLSVLLSRPNAEWQREIETVGSELADPQLRDGCSAALEEAAEGVYHSVFGPGGPAPPREASYRSTLQLGYLLAELEAYYDAFGYVPAEDETPDHVAVEADFIAYLRMKRALAESLGQSEQAEVAAQAESAFLEDHLSFIAEPLQQSLAFSGVRYLEIASTALFDRVGPARSTEAEPQELADQLVKIEDANFSCGP